MTDRSLKLFYCYSHEDEVLRGRLEKHLSPLERQGVISGWDDRQIGAGKEWDGEISEHLENAQIILLLVSADFLASDYCYDIEMNRALERHKTSDAQVIPIILKPVDWQDTPFSKLQALPNNGKPVTCWPDNDAAFYNIAKGIRKVSEELLKKLDMQDPYLANKDEGPPAGAEEVIGFGEKKSYLMTAPKYMPVLSLKARINFSHEAGSTWIMKIIVNGRVIQNPHLLNKPLAKEYRDGRVRPWFSYENESWHLSYSPNFKDNYLHTHYKVMNGDPYAFVFGLSGIEKRDGKYEVLIQHTGQKDIDAHKNPIIVQDVAIF